MANKIDRMVTYSEEFPLVELHDPSIMWFCGVTLQIKDFISIWIRPMATKHGKVATYWTTANKSSSICR